MALDRLDEAAAVPGLDVGFAIESLHRRQPGRHGRDQQDLAATVTRDPERGRAGPRRLGTAAGEDEDEDGTEPG